MSASRWRKLFRVLRAIAVMALATLFIFVLFEGLLSTGYFIVKLATDSQPALAERRHTEYDPRLGWVNLPNVSIDDLYGPGRTFHTNGQRFRATHDFSEAVPPGRTRVICSGDSFTLGYGVADPDTWCDFLGRLDRRIEPVNMGQGGYGVDQAYLWYVRDGQQLDHDVHLFAFIFGDFPRMAEARFLGYGKPVLKLEDGEVVVSNAPVPRRGYLAPWFTQNASLFDELRSVAAVRALVGRLSSPSSPTQDSNFVMPVALAIFERLEAHHRARGSELVLVYLPVEEDHSGAYDGFRARMADELGNRGITFVDLTQDFRALWDHEAQRVFITDDESGFPDARGHYSAAGNAFIAESLYRRLIEIPGINQRLEQENAQVE